MRATVLEWGACSTASARPAVSRARAQLVSSSIAPSANPKVSSCSSVLPHAEPVCAVPGHGSASCGGAEPMLNFV